MNKKLLFYCIAILLVVVAYYLGKSPDRIDVTLHKVAKGEVKTSVSNTRVGTVKACRRAYLAPSTGGNVAKLFVKEGERVKQQQLLLEVWNDDLKAQLKLHRAQIKANRATAKQICVLAAGAERDAQRLRRLEKIDNIISEEQVDRASTSAKAQWSSCKASRAGIEIAQANLAIVKAAIERTLVRAPFDGTVAEINAELGEYVTPSPPGIPTLPPIDLLDISCLTVSAPIDEVDAPQIKMGMTACVSLDAFEEPRCSGTVTRIAPYVLEKEKQARTVEVEIKLSKKKDLNDLLPGYSADIEVLVARKVSALRVPTEAVLENNQVLLVKQGGLLEERQIQPGLSNWNFIEVLSGLSENDMIVLSVGREGVESGVTVRAEE
ncbi:MAG: efflux RND transporter periplasmic adaptor subunit [Methylococcales bacterium]|nr:efflux RND transporter periplasmic adaptor subunit [Methylococcales bacterium]